MTTLQRIFGFLCLILVVSNAHAASIPLQLVTEEDMKKVAGDMSANFLHSSVSGANTLGSIWGFEIGVVGGQASTPNLNEVVHKTDPNEDAGKLYNAALLGVLTVPLGITGEVSLLPKQTISGISFNTTSAALKWTLTETLLSDLPFSLAVKAVYTTADVKFSQTISSNTIDFAIASKTTAGMVLISKNLAILEPYAAVGMVSGKGDLSANSTSVFSTTPGATSASGSKSGLMFALGTEVKLLVLKIGAEYASVLGDSRIGAKVSFYF